MSFTYRGLKAENVRHIVTEAEIDRQIERLQQQNPRIAIVTDRPTENGDEVVLDYAGFCNGVQFPGGTAEKQTLVLGTNQVRPGDSQGSGFGARLRPQARFGAQPPEAALSA